MPVDYSKFDDIVDSDEEREKKVKKEAEAKKCPPADTKPVCGNCRAENATLKCGVCKVQVYCSRKCQAADWPYHKRICKKPEEKKKEDEKREKTPPRKKTPEESKARGKSEKVQCDSDDDVGDWYRHRQWKAPQNIVDVKPQKVAESVPTPPKVVKNEGSDWNVAGTFEERVMTTWAKNELRPLFVGQEFECKNGVVEVTEVSEWEGDANIAVIRGEKRYLYDLTFSLKWKAQVLRSDGKRATMNGLSKYIDVCNDEPFPKPQVEIVKSEVAPDIKQNIVAAVKGEMATVVESQFNLWLANFRKQ